MPIRLDWTNQASASGDGTTTGTTGSLTPAGVHRMLVACVMYSGNSFVDSIVWNSTPSRNFVFLAGRGGVNTATEVWFLRNPTTDAHTATVTFESGEYWGLLVQNYKYARQKPFSTPNTGTGTGTLTGSIASTSTLNYVMQAGTAMKGTTGNALTPNKTPLMNQDVGSSTNTRIAGVQIVAVPSGTETLEWTQLVGTNTWTTITVEIRHSRVSEMIGGGNIPRSR